MKTKTIKTPRAQRIGGASAFAREWIANNPKAGRKQFDQVMTTKFPKFEKDVAGLKSRFDFAHKLLKKAAAQKLVKATAKASKPASKTPPARRSVPPPPPRPVAQA